MALFNFQGIKIAGIASAVPSEIVKVDSFEKQFGKETVEKFQEMTGVKEFRKAGERQTASDLSYVAAKKLIKESKIDTEEVGALIFVSQYRDYMKPSTACVLHKRLELSKDCMAFDVCLGCSAFVYGISILSSFMNNSNINKALLLIGDTGSKSVNEKDRSVTMLFGDAGCAILLEKTTEPQMIQTSLHTDGKGYQSIIVPAGGFRNREASRQEITWEDGNVRTLYDTNMNGKKVFTFTIFDVVDSIKEYFEKTQTSVEDYDLFFFHQANRYIHEQISKRLGIPLEKMPISLDRYGNTAGSTIPLLLSDYCGTKSGKKHVLMCGFGVGLSWGIVSADIDMSVIYPVEETDDYFAEGIINGPEDLL
jgi:3-oxoacyl-[acyl-carrier-protein] synthase-3